MAGPEEEHRVESRMRGPQVSRSSYDDHQPERRSSVESLAADLAAHERRTDLSRDSYQAATARRAAEARLDRLDLANERTMLANVAFHWGERGAKLRSSSAATATRAS